MIYFTFSFQATDQEKGDQSGFGKVQGQGEQVQQGTVLRRSGPDLRKRRTDLQKPMLSGPGHLSVRIKNARLTVLMTRLTT